MEADSEGSEPITCDWVVIAISDYTRSLVLVNQLALPVSAVSAHEGNATEVHCNSENIYTINVEIESLYSATCKY